MSDIRTKYVTPSVDQTAFNCPHCGALAKQHWYSCHGDEFRRDNLPVIITHEMAQNTDLSKEKEENRDRIRRMAAKAATGVPFFGSAQTVYDAPTAHNVWLSRCYNCDEVAVWVYNQQMYPRQGEGPLPNPDLSAEVMRDYREASSILNASPRGAAALLRLCIQKICAEVGGKGENVNDDIKLLVANGLDQRVQQALDVVRVIGNNAVHPGQIDLSDDRATAEQLFILVNLIADRMISQPKHVQSMFDALPETAKQQIESRDAPPAGGGKK